MANVNISKVFSLLFVLFGLLKNDALDSDQCHIYFIVSRLVFTCSKLTMGTPIKTISEICSKLPQNRFHTLFWCLHC